MKINAKILFKTILLLNLCSLVYIFWWKGLNMYTGYDTSFWFQDILAIFAYFIFFSTFVISIFEVTKNRAFLSILIASILFLIYDYALLDKIFNQKLILLQGVERSVENNLILKNNSLFELDSYSQYSRQTLKGCFKIGGDKIWLYSFFNDTINTSNNQKYLNEINKGDRIKIYLFNEGNDNQITIWGNFVTVMHKYD